jgi:transposase
MQDGVGVHPKKELVAWLKGKGYNVIVWPPYSLDPNSIEHVWAVVVEKIKSAVF